MSEQTPVKRVRTRHFAAAKAAGRKITGLTAYDAPSATVFDRAGIDLLLVGDSAANVMLGYDTTLPITVDELITMTRSVSRSVQRAFVVADLPFGSYEESTEQALHTAVRFMKEGGAHGIKLEGGVRVREQIRRITDSGIPVVGHIGYTPQSEHNLGGHVIQGREQAAQEQLLADGLAVQEAGAFAVIVEMVPAELARRLTETLDIPTISVGAGPYCDGQMNVWTDTFGYTSGRIPKFVRRYGDLAGQLEAAARHYIEDVRAVRYPGEAESY